MVRDFAVSRSLQPWCKEDRKWVPTPAACHPERSEGSRLEIFPRRLSEPDFSQSLPWAVRARFFASLRMTSEEPALIPQSPFDFAHGPEPVERREKGLRMICSASFDRPPIRSLPSGRSSNQSSPPHAPRALSPAQPCGLSLCPLQESPRPSRGPVHTVCDASG